MAAAVQGQVIGPGEGAVALGAAEGLDTRVLAEVSGQLVGAGEAPGAALPGAVIRLLTCRRRSRKTGVSPAAVNASEATYRILWTTSPKFSPTIRRWLAVVGSPVCILRCALRWELFV